MQNLRAWECAVYLFHFWFCISLFCFLNSRLQFLYYYVNSFFTVCYVMFLFWSVCVAFWPKKWLIIYLEFFNIDMFSSHISLKGLFCLVQCTYWHCSDTLLGITEYLLYCLHDQHCFCFGSLLFMCELEWHLMRARKRKRKRSSKKKSDDSSSDDSPSDDSIIMKKKKKKGEQRKRRRIKAGSDSSTEENDSEEVS